MIGAAFTYYTRIVIIASQTFDLRSDLLLLCTRSITLLEGGIWISSSLCALLSSAGACHTHETARVSMPNWYSRIFFLVDSLWSGFVSSYLENAFGEATCGGVGAVKNLFASFTSAFGWDDLSPLITTYLEAYNLLQMVLTFQFFSLR